MNTLYEPLQVLIISRSKDNSLSNIYTSMPNGDRSLIYTVYGNKGNSKLEVSYADVNHPGGQVVGTIRFHTLSSKIDINLHGTSFTMARKDVLGMGGHYFSNMAFGSDVQWKETSTFGSDMQMLDSQKRLIAKYSKKLKLSPAQTGFSSLIGAEKSASGLEIFMPIHDLVLLDLIVLTGLASGEYRRQSNEDWGLTGKKGAKGAVEELVYGLLGI